MPRQSNLGTAGERRVAAVPAELAGLRFDQALAILFSDFSRAQLQRWIRDGRATAGGRCLRPRDKVAAGQRVELIAELRTAALWLPQALPLAIVHQDEELIVIDKPAGLVVHPGAGNRDGTLVNALLHHDPALAALPRAGVVHRLDKETTGLLVVARTWRSHKALVEQLRTHRVAREYNAIVVGRVTAGRRVDAPIGRHPVQRTRMAVVPSGRPAVTRFQVLTRFRNHTLLRVALETGRTHQIRVHLAHVHHPLLGDRVYGRRLAIPAGVAPRLADALRAFRRQALHARRLALVHPASGHGVAWEAPPPADFAALLGALEDDARRAMQTPA